ncbi:MAG TPA: hypothetical protein VJZ00_22960 [Thermoanaerobaculia bacterium]|nr:hypothetical protein [Thermoanaerobaculia bacterium]
MNINYATLEEDVMDGKFRAHLQEELAVGFRQLQMDGERLPVPSHYASQIAEIINREADLPEHVKYELYQEVLLAVENAAATVRTEVV